MSLKWFRGCFASSLVVDVVDACNACKTCVIWDIENVRPPLPPAPLLKTLSALSQLASSTQSRRIPIVCCVTTLSLRRIEKELPTFMRDAVTLMDVRIASLVPKRGADYVLNLEILRLCSHGGTDTKKRIVLLTGDADFLGPVQVALENGVDVQLIYKKESCAKVLLDLKYSSKPIEYMEFLRTVHGDKKPIQLIGDRDQACNVNPALQEHCKFSSGWVINKRFFPIIPQHVGGHVVQFVRL